MKKYAIKKEFFPFSHFTPPINKSFLSLSAYFMKAPKMIFKDKEINIEKYLVKSYDNEQIECLMISPNKVDDELPCLIYIHGGGFVLKAAGYHYKNAVKYAKRLKCRVFFINYRLAPKYPHPIFFEDCYYSVDWLFNHSEELGIDKNRIGIAGDSAGSTLAVGMSIMVKERKHPIKFLFQMLPYPFLDARNNSESCKKYIDTPMWNSRLSTKIKDMTKVDKNNHNYLYYSPVELDNFDFFPPTYIETAEFDCLHDDGILFAELLTNNGIEVMLNETKGTIHGFDIVQKAETTIMVIDDRISFMSCFFNKN